MTYVTNLLAVNALCVDSGGTGGHNTMLEALNELCSLQSVAFDNVTNLGALNAIAVGLGSEGGYVTNLGALNGISAMIGGSSNYVDCLSAWSAIAASGFINPVQDADFYAHLTGAPVLTGGKYYLNDSSANAHHCQLVSSYAVKFGGNTAYIDLSSAENTIHIINGQTTAYKLKMRIDDISISKTAYSDNMIFECGGAFASWGGFIVTLDSSHFVVRVSTGSATQDLVFSTVMDTNWHTYTFTFNCAAKTVAIDVDGTTETKSITAGGTSFTTTAKGFQCGYYSTSGLGKSARFTLANFEVLQSGSQVFDLPCCTNMVNLSLYDRVGGSAYNVRNSTADQTNDVYPANILNGFELYTRAGYDNYYIPYRTNGSKITPTITSWSKAGEYPAGAGHNYAETKVRINSIDYTATQLTAYPFTKNISKFTATLITEVMAFTDTKSVSEREATFRYLGYTVFDMSGFIGDSIMAGIYALVSSLPSDYNNPISAKIWDLASQSWQDVTKNNCQQPIDAGHPNTFSPILGYLKYKNAGRGAEYAFGGAICATHWQNGGLYNTAWKTNMTAAFTNAMHNGYYPHWVGMYVCLGTNDASTVAYRDAIDTNAAALIADLRAYTGEDLTFNWLLPRSNDASRIIVRNKLLAMTTTGLLLYESDDLSYYDSVHPDYDGTIALGEMFYLGNSL